MEGGCHTSADEEVAGLICLPAPCHHTEGRLHKERWSGGNAKCVTSAHSFYAKPHVLRIVEVFIFVTPIFCICFQPFITEENGGVEREKGGDK